MARGSLHFAALAVAALAIVSLAVGGFILAPHFGVRADGCGCAVTGSSLTPWLLRGASLGLLVWMGWAVLRTLRSTRRFLSRARETTRPFDARPYGVTDVDVRLEAGSDRVFCTGLFQPSIVLGERLLQRLSRPELAAVLAHETAHAKRRDPLRLLIVESLAAALGPWGKRLAERFRLDLELDADERAIERHGRARVAQAFLALVESPQKPAPVAVPFLSVTEARALRLLEEHSREIPWRTLTVAAGVVLAAFIGLRSAVRAVEQAPTVPAALCRAVAYCPRPTIKSEAPRVHCHETPTSTWCVRAVPRSAALPP